MLVLLVVVIKMQCSGCREFSGARKADGDDGGDGVVGSVMVVMMSEGCCNVSDAGVGDVEG